MIVLCTLGESLGQKTSPELLVNDVICATGVQAITTETIEYVKFCYRCEDVKINYRVLYA